MGAHWATSGRFDDAGYLYIVDRKKDMIISGGSNVCRARSRGGVARDGPGTGSRGHRVAASEMGARW